MYKIFFLLVLISSFSLSPIFAQELQLNPIDALILIKKIIRRIKQVNGSFISIWHNESLMNERRWLNWPSVYEDMIKYIFNEID